MSAKPRIAVTMGDPAGVGPELCLRLLAEPEIEDLCTPIIFGDAGILNRVAVATGIEPPKRIVGRSDWAEIGAELDSPFVLDLRPPGLEALKPGLVSLEGGRAAWTFICEAIAAALDGSVDAITTAPINKEALREAGIPYPGHTEILAAKTGAEHWCMMQYSDEVTATFVTCHIGIAELPAAITEERVSEVIDLTAAALERLPGRPSKTPSSRQLKRHALAASKSKARCHQTPLSCRRSERKQAVSSACITIRATSR